MSAITDILNNPQPLPVLMEEPLRTRLRASRACDVCASLKCKCDGQQDQPCQRCARLRLSCTYTRIVKKRGGSRVKSRSNSISKEELVHQYAAATKSSPRRFSDTDVSTISSTITTYSGTPISQERHRRSSIISYPHHSHPQISHPYSHHSIPTTAPAPLPRLQTIFPPTSYDYNKNHHHLPPNYTAITTSNTAPSQPLSTPTSLLNSWSPSPFPQTSAPRYPYTMPHFFPPRSSHHQSNQVIPPSNMSTAESLASYRWSPGHPREKLDYRREPGHIYQE